MEREVAVCAVMTSPGDPGESMENSCREQLIHNDVTLLVVDYEWTHCVFQCLGKENTLHVVR